MNSSKQIDNYISGLTDWRGEVLAKLRRITLDSHQDITEEWKWNSPVWSYNGMVCSASAFKEHIGLNFFRGAELKDPNKLFNSGFDSKKSRSIKFLEKDSVNVSALKKLIREAVALNSTGKNKKK